MKIRRTLPPLLLVGFSFAVTASAQEAARRLHALFDERYAWEMREFPETAMSRGDYTNAHRITDNSLEAVERRHQETTEHLRLLTTIDASSLDAADRLNHRLFERLLRNRVERHRFRLFLSPVGGRSGPHQRIPQMAERVRFNTPQDYTHYLDRLEQTPQSIVNSMAMMRRGVSQGRTPPRVTLLGLPGQFDALLSGGLDALSKPFENMPAVISNPRRSELRNRFRNRSMPAVREAIGKMRDFVVNEYLPGCRTSIAATDLPDGEAYYAFQLRTMTTTELTAAQIHELGVKEVARIRAEMMAVIRGSDFVEKFPVLAELSDQQLFRSFIHYLRTDDRFYHATPEDLLRGYRDICKRVDAWLPKFFSALPRLPYGVREIPAFMAPNQTTAYYSQGDIRNAEPGYFYANTYALDQRPKYEMIALAIHEAVPGHHLQIALAQELEDVPEFRKNSWITAFGEGWALYSERLGLEADMYENPYDDFGRLLYEMWRACRLVVDPGMHALGWSRERAVAFLLDNTALSELNVNNEIDRYIAWPGQATAYKIGELTIRDLRKQAEKTLGERFDIRAFHDVVLGAGCIPLTVLERRVEDWIENRNRGDGA